MNTLKSLIKTLVIASSLGFFSLPVMGQTKPDNQCPNSNFLVPQTMVVNFMCSRDSNTEGIETLSVETERCRTPLVRSTSARFDVPCQKIATRFQQFYNCGILDNLSTGFWIMNTGDRYPAIFAQIKPSDGNQPATLDLCPALKPSVKDGKLLLLLFEQGVDMEQMRNLLDDLRIGIADKPM